MLISIDPKFKNKMYKINPVNLYIGIIILISESLYFFITVFLIHNFEIEFKHSYKPQTHI